MDYIPTLTIVLAEAELHEPLPKTNGSKMKPRYHSNDLVVAAVDRYVRGQPSPYS